MSNDFKVCPECREEYTLVAEQCADCDVPLVFPDEVPPEPEPEAFPEVSELECVRVGPLPWTRAISAGLEEAGIPHRVEHDTRSEAEGGVDPRKFDDGTLYGTWVRPADLDAAKAIDSTIFAHIDEEVRVDAPATGDETCPACTSPLPPDALECPDCGLQFG